MNKYPNIDGQTLEIASFSDIPKQPVSIARTQTFLNTQLQRMQTKLATPVVDSQAPLNIVRRNLLNGNLQFRVQFIAPTRRQAPDYRSTTVVLQTPSGTQRFAAAAAAGPIIFNTPKTSAPGSLALQQSNANSNSDVRVGTGNSRTLVQL